MAAPDKRSRLRELLSAASDEWRATPFYRLMLGGGDPDRVSQWGLDHRPGDAVRGREILVGQWRIASERLTGQHPQPWGAPPPSPHFSARLHSFSWLRDLNAVGPDAQDQIAALIHAWVDGFGEWHPQAWAPELAAERVYMWLCHGRAAFERGDAAMRPALMRSLARQARHLQLAANDIREPLARIRAGVALALAGAALPADGGKLIEQGVELLEEAAASQFLADGGHQSRAPEALVEALGDLLTADDALARAGVETPRLVRDLSPKLANMIRYLRLGDGGMAAFNGGGEGFAGAAEAVLEHSGGTPRAFRIAPQSGFHRLAAGKTIVVIDGGAAPPPAFGERAHAGALSFEMSCGEDRVIVNVGSARELIGAWRAAGRATNGHSTLIVDDALSADFEAARLGKAARPKGPPGISAKRNDDDAGAWIDLQHEGYRADYGFIHRRTIYLDTAGNDLRGVDSLSRPLNAGSAKETHRIPFAIRFHLHPKARAIRTEQRVVRLETPSGSHWRMRTDAAAVQIEDSVYLSADGVPQPSLQVVLHGEADPGSDGAAAPNRVRWAFTRIDPG
jgi:uncharacterized heparinase superfamily protein